MNINSGPLKSCQKNNIYVLNVHELHKVLSILDNLGFIFLLPEFLS